MNAHGKVHKYGSNVDTDVIIPARYLNTADHKELASHCMEDIDKDFINKVADGDIMVAEENFGCGSSREHAPIAIKASGISCVEDRELLTIEDHVTVHIGYRNFCCRDEVVACSFDMEHIFAEFRELTCAIHGVFMNHEGRENFCIAAGCMCIEHEVHDASLESCAKTTVEGETCACNGCACFGVKNI